MTFLLNVLFIAAVAEPLTATRLRVEHHPADLATDANPPRLSWWTTGSGNDRQATSHAIRVQRDGAVIWESGVRPGGGGSFVPLETALEPLSTYQVSVRISDAAGGEGPWSPVHPLRTGMRDRPWTAAWISSFPGVPPELSTEQRANLGAGGEPSHHGQVRFSTTFTVPTDTHGGVLAVAALGRCLPAPRASVRCSTTGSQDCGPSSPDGGSSAARRCCCPKSELSRVHGPRPRDP
jgi:hypothetical protein